MILAFMEHIAITLLSDVSITDEQTDERVATCLDELRPTVWNQVVLGNPVLNRLEMSPYKEEINGGARVRFPIKYGKNNTVSSFGKGSVRTPSNPALMGFAYFNMKQLAGEFAVDWVEEREQAGSGNVIDLVAQRAESLAMDAREYMNSLLWQTALRSEDDPNGIPIVIPSDPRTGIYAGFDRASRYWWRNWYYDGTSLSYGRHPIDASAGAPSSIGAFGSISNKYSECLKRMGTCFNSISAGESARDYFIITDQLVYEAYCDISQHMGTFTVTYTKDDDIVKYEFGGAQFRGMPVLFDTIQNGAESGALRFINTRVTKLISDSGAWFVWSEKRVPYNQFAYVRYLLMRYQLACYAPWKNGILQGITAWA